jgi:hypothetical protein
VHPLCAHADGSRTFTEALPHKVSSEHRCRMARDDDPHPGGLFRVYSVKEQPVNAHVAIPYKGH